MFWSLKINYLVFKISGLKDCKIFRQTLEGFILQGIAAFKYGFIPGFCG